MIADSKTPRVVAIHQPNFFPWLGYFHKIVNCDVFMFLDDVEFSKGSYTNRSRIKTDGREKWLSMPVQYKSTATIAEIQIGQTDWVDEHKKKLSAAYGKASQFSSVFPYIENIYDNGPKRSVAAFNASAICAIAKLLDLSTTLVSSSDYAAPGRNEHKLCALIQAVDGHTYLSGKGGANYQSEQTFANAGITLQYSQFKPAEYPQLGSDFVAGLSILDALFNIGVDATRGLLFAAKSA